MVDSWHDVAGVEDVPDDDLVQVTVDETQIAIYKLGAEFFATSDICTHGGACLSDGFVIGDEIECPLHQGRFHIPTGAARGAPASIDLATYPVKTENGRILIQLPSA